MSNGYMLAIEGTDKAGKHTQVMKIMQYLHSRGIMAEALDFPQYNAFFGRMVRDYLNGKFVVQREIYRRNIQCCRTPWTDYSTSPRLTIGCGTVNG